MLRRVLHIDLLHRPQRSIISSCCSRAAKAKLAGAKAVERTSSSAESQDIGSKKKLVPKARDVVQGFLRQMGASPAKTTFSMIAGKPRTCVVSMDLPTYSSPFEFRASDRNKRLATIRAFSVACHELQNIGLLDEQFIPILSRLEQFLPKVDEPIAIPHSSPMPPAANLLVKLYNSAGKPGSYKVDTKRIAPGRYQGVCRISWPESKEFRSVHHSKKEAKSHASAKAVLHLKSLGYFDLQWQPRLFEERDKRALFDLKRQPTVVKLDSALLEQLEDLEEKFNKLHCEISSIVQENEQQFEALTEESLNRFPLRTPNSKSSSFLLDGTASSTVNQEENIVRHPITGRDVRLVPNTQRRSANLQDQLMRFRGSSQYSIQKFRMQREQLPISKYRSEIESVLDNNQVCVVVGDTGSGKSTQVPQFIFEQAIERGEGAQCNMIITQPRRISALSLAQRVSQERIESLRESVGFRVRLNSQVPRAPGALLFTTPGMLIQTMASNPQLEGLSHVIIDEVHERDLWSDFLLVVMKTILKERPQLKLVLMSASVQADKFAAYFNDCPIVSVEGRTYPVEEHFIEDFSNYLPHRVLPKQGLDENAILKDNTKLIAETVKYIDSSRGEGAILCFLSGWQEIQATKRLLDSFGHLKIYRCHSRLPVNEQQRIFEKAPDGKRKVILATNIAETSITVNDVVYVVNSGNMKALAQDEDDAQGLVSSVARASRSSQKQRAGRAGRVQPGECFHLFTRDQFQSIPQYQTPAILTEPLDQLIVQLKLFFPHSNPTEFLEQAMDAPETEQISDSLRDLSEMGIMERTCDEIEWKLTPLGRRCAHFGCKPAVARTVYYAALFGCLSSVVSVVAKEEQGRSLLIQHPDLNSETRALSKLFSCDSSSDSVSHVNLSNLITDARSHTILIAMSRQRDAFSAEFLKAPRSREFMEDKLVDVRSLDTINGVSKIFIDNAMRMGLAETQLGRFDSMAQMNQNSNVQHLAILNTGRGHNLARSSVGQIKGNKIVKDAVIYLDEMNNRVRIPADSCVNDKLIDNNDWLSYSAKVRETTQMRVIRSVSLLHPLAPVLLSTAPFTTHCSQNAVCLESNDNFRLRFVSNRELSLILDLRAAVEYYSHWMALDMPYVLEKMNRAECGEELRDFGDKLVDLVVDLLSCDVKVKNC